MRLNKIVPGSERVGTRRAGGPALKANGDRPTTSVLRRSGRPRPSFSRRNERPTWGGPAPRVDFGYLGFMLAVAATVFVAVYVALGRGA